MRIYVATDAEATIRAIANLSSHSYPSRSDLLVCCDDAATFYAVLYDGRMSGSDYFNGTIKQPALDIDGVAISFANGQFTYNGTTYVLDEDATVDEIITKPIIDLVSIVQTCAGYYVVARNELDLRMHFYLDGTSLQVISSSRARSGDVVEDSRFVGHHYIVTGDHMDTSRQRATFDGQSATILDPKDYVATFADDLSTITVEKK